MLHICLDFCVNELASNETLGVENGVGRIHGDIADQMLTIGKGDIRGGRAVTRPVDDDFYSIVLPDNDA